MVSNLPPREWITYQYFDPREVLLKLAKIEKTLIGLPLEEKLLQLRANKLRKFHERRQAAIFCYGMSCLNQGPIEYAPVEDSDFDCIARWKYGDTINYCPIQTKEFVPADINPHTILDAEIAKLKKYTDSKNLVVAFYLNRQGHFEFPDVRSLNLNIAELWMFGATSPDGRHWALYGDVLKEPRKYSFDYPT